MTTMSFTLMQQAAIQREHELRSVARGAWRRPRRSGRSIFARTEPGWRAMTATSTVTVDGAVPAASRPVVVVGPGEGHRVGNVVFLARTEDTPFYNLAIVVLAPGQGVEAHVHRNEDDAFLVLEGTLSLTLGDDAQPVEAGPWTYVLVPAGTRHAIANTGRRGRPAAERARARSVSTGGSGWDPSAPASPCDT